MVPLPLEAILKMGYTSSSAAARAAYHGTKLVKFLIQLSKFWVVHAEFSTEAKHDLSRSASSHTAERGRSTFPARRGIPQASLCSRGPGKERRTWQRLCSKSCEAVCGIIRHVLPYCLARVVISSAENRVTVELRMKPNRRPPLAMFWARYISGREE